MLKKIYKKIKLFWYSLFFGMKGVNNLLTSNQKEQNNSVLEISEDGSDGVFKDILEQKVTQEVEELRYSSYKVANEAKKYCYIGNGKVIKKTETQLSEKHGLIEESDNLPIILIQDNSIICEDILTSLNEINQKENKKVFYDFKLKIKRNILPRFRIENYIKKLVLKESDGNYVIDLYCSKYPSQFSERKDKSFLSELKKIQNKEVRNSDILDFEELSFITNNAWGMDDWFKFSFLDFEYYDIIEFDGHYIIRMGCQSNIFMENILDKIYSKSAEEKYSKKEMKNNIINFIPLQKEEDIKLDKINLENLENIQFLVEKKIK